MISNVPMSRVPSKNSSTYVPLMHGVTVRGSIIHWPVKMARAMRAAVDSGRLAFEAGRIPRRTYAEASTSMAGMPDLGEHQAARRR